MINTEWRVINALNGKVYGTYGSEAAAFTDQSKLSNIAIVQTRSGPDAPWKLVDPPAKQGPSPLVLY